MNPKAVSKAKDRLALAYRQLDAASQAKSHGEFSDHWYLFLVATKNIYTSLEQGTKVSPQSLQWYGAVKKIRRDDELLQYLFQARDDAEHGVEAVTRFEPGHLIVGGSAYGHSKSHSMDMVIDSQGVPTITRLQSLDGLPVYVHQENPRTVLATVTGRGDIKYEPPTKHLGRTLQELSPIELGRLALSYFETLIKDAESRVT